MHLTRDDTSASQTYQKQLDVSIGQPLLDDTLFDQTVQSEVGSSINRCPLRQSEAEVSHGIGSKTLIKLLKSSTRKWTSPDWSHRSY